MKNLDRPSGLVQKTANSLRAEGKLPSYIYDSTIFRRDAQEAISAFSGFEVLYAFKANPFKPICNLALECELGADVSSLAELNLAQEMGFKPKNIVFGGPGKTTPALVRKVVSSDCVVSLESENEIEAFSVEASKQKKKVRTLLRVNSKHRPTEAGEFMAGGPSQYGIDEEAIESIANNYQNTKLSIEGVHVHVASQVLSEENFVEHLQKTTSIGIQTCALFESELKTINFGGGLGIPYDSSTTKPDAKRIEAAYFAKRRDRMEIEPNKVLLQLELGRSIVGRCGYFATEILDVKQSRGTQYVICRSGISAFSRPAMHWANDHTIFHNGDFCPQDGNTVVTGESCLPADILARGVSMKKPKIGDILFFSNAGAYGYTMSMLDWSGFQKPGQILI